MRPSQEFVDAIYRDKVLRARKMPPLEKLFDGLRLFEQVCERMKAGLRSENPGVSEEGIQTLLTQRLAILRRLDERPCPTMN